MNPPDLSRRTVAALLSLTAAAFWCLGLDYLLGGAPYGDDNSSHFAVILAVARTLEAGQFDFFFAENNLGVALFLSYQPLPSFLMALLLLLTSGWLEPLLVFKASILALWSLMPVAWYLGGRWLGLSRTAALVLGMLTLAVEDPQFYGFTFASVAYKGLYTQSFGLFLFPLGLGSWWRWLQGRGGSRAAAVSWMTLTFLSHIFFGLTLGIASALMVMGAGWRRRVWRAATAYALSIGIMSFWMVPLLQHVSLVGGLPWKTTTHNGWPLLLLLQKAMGGVLLDQGRFPWLTILVATSVVALWRGRKTRLHWWLFRFGAVIFVLFLGRTNLGRLYQWIPLHRELNVMRYLSALHISALLCVAFAVEQWRLRSVKEGFWIRWVGRERWWLFAAAVVLWGGFTGERLWQHTRKLQTFDHRAPAFSSLQKFLRRDRGHRFLVDGSLKTGSHFHRDLLPALAGRPQVQSYGMTFHAHLSQYFAEYFDWSAEAYRLYGVTAVVARTSAPRIPLKPIVPVFQAKPYAVFSPREKGIELVETIRVPFAIRGSYKKMRPFLKRHLISWYKRGILPQITQKPSGMRWEVRVGRSGAVSYWEKGVRSTPSSFARYLSSLPAGRRKAVVHARRDGAGYVTAISGLTAASWLLLKVNYFPYWSASSGSQTWPVRQVAPGFMAIRIPAGTRWVRFRYRNPTWQKGWFLVTLLWLFLSLVGWGWRRLRSPPSAPPLAPGVQD